MHSRLSLFLLVSVLVSITVKAEGLSWTDPNQDTLCDAKVSFVCSTAKIRLIEGGEIAGLKYHSVYVFFFLYPALPDNRAVSMDLTIVVETQDRLKHTYTQKVPIQTDTSKTPNGNSLTIRYCTMDIPSLGQGVTTVWSIDGTEERPDGKPVVAHRFR
jgi:hypothetical protein